MKRCNLCTKRRITYLLKVEVLYAEPRAVNICKKCTVVMYHRVLRETGFRSNRVILEACKIEPKVFGKTLGG